MENMENLKKTLSMQYLNALDEYEEGLRFILEDETLSELALFNVFMYGFICGKRKERERRKKGAK